MGAGDRSAPQCIAHVVVSDRIAANVDSLFMYLVLLTQRGFKLREELAQYTTGQPLPSSIYLLPDTPQIKGLHTFIRNKDTPRDEFIFYSKRLIRLVIEYALSLLPFKVTLLFLCFVRKSNVV